MKFLEVKNNTSHANEMVINIDNIIYIQSAITTYGSIIRLADGTSIRDNRTVSELKKELNNL